MTSKQIENFAPVIIPTLCRFEHFRNCIESLMACTHAENTDVFVGLDYPAKEEHWKGYLKISKYLDELKDHHNFKSLNVIKREINYGLGAEGNITQLYEYIFSVYDSVIFSEDDNIFSPSFLDYINKGLIIYKSDRSVLAINGYRHYYKIKTKGNSFIRQNIDFSAWGFGIWKDRYMKTKSLDSNWFKKRLNIKNLLKIKFNQGNNRLIDFINISKSPVCLLTDNVLSVYMGLTNKCVIAPTLSLVKNTGWDGTGQNCKNKTLELVNKFNNQLISSQNEFSFIGNGMEFFYKNKKLYRRQSYAKISNIYLINKIILKLLTIK